VRLLRRFGAEPVFPKGQTCCGQPAFNVGYEAQARAAAEHFLWEFDGDDPIVTPSGSCAAMVKHHYPWLFRDDPKRLAKAQRAGERIYELTQFLVHVLKAHEAGCAARNGHLPRIVPPEPVAGRPGGASDAPVFAERRDLPSHARRLPLLRLRRDVHGEAAGDLLRAGGREGRFHRGDGADTVTGAIRAAS